MAQNVPVILARDVANLGRVGQLVNVRPGYARNFLVPTGVALPASPKRVAFFEHQKKVIEHRRRQLRGESEKKAKAMSGVQITLTAKVGEQNKLFGAITVRDIARALTAIGHPMHHKDVKLTEPIKTIGIYTVDVRLEADVAAQIKVIVVADESAPPPAVVEDALPLAAAPEVKPAEA